MISETYNMDCLIYMQTMPDKYFDLAIVDPPYGINAGNVYTEVSKVHGNSKAKRSAYKIGWDNQAPDADYFNELIRVSKNQIVWGANHFISRMPFDSSCWIFWNKENGKNDFADGELAWCSFHTAVRVFTYRWAGMLQGNMKQKEERIHPTQKPIALYKWLLQNYAKKGDKILDTHLGSQSSRIAAYEMGFDFFGTELDCEYFEAGNRRFELFKQQASLFTPEQKETVTSIGANLFPNEGVKPNRALK